MDNFKNLAKKIVFSESEKGVKLDWRKSGSLAAAFIVSVMVLATGPATALTLNLGTDKLIYVQGEDVNFNFHVDINNGEIVPIELVSMDIVGPSDSILGCEIPFNPAGYSNQTVVCGGHNLKVSLVPDSNFGSAFGERNVTFKGDNFNFGYGYGFGDEPSGTLSSFFDIFVTLEIPSDWDRGVYNAAVKMEAENDVVFSDSTKFTIGNVDHKNERCIGNVKIVAFYTPIENDFKTKKKVSITADNITRLYNEKFVDEVKVEGWGKTSFGDYLGYFDGAFHLNSVPIDFMGRPLVIGVAGVDPSIIPLGLNFTVPQIQSPWDNIVYKTVDIGSYTGWIFNIYTGEGAEAGKDMNRITRGNWRICPA